jgi:hypothetical protein
MKQIGIFYGHLEYITAILYNLWPLCYLEAIWYIFTRFGIINKEKSGNPGPSITLESAALNSLLRRMKNRT